MVVSKAETQQRDIGNALEVLRNQSSSTSAKSRSSIPQVTRMFGIAESTLRRAIKDCNDLEKKGRASVEKETSSIRVRKREEKQEKQQNQARLEKKDQA